MSTEYPLPPTSTVAEIVEVLKKLKTDAEVEAGKQAAKAFFDSDNQDARNLAHQYEGKREMLSSLLWALGGTAENDGCSPTVDIH